MSSPTLRTAIPALLGRFVVSAYMFGGDADAHGLVLTLEGDTELSIEFDCQSRLVSRVLECKGKTGDAVLLQEVSS